MYRNNFERLEYPSIPGIVFISLTNTTKNNLLSEYIFVKRTIPSKHISNTKTEITLIALNKDADNEADHTDSF